MKKLNLIRDAIFSLIIIAIFALTSCTTSTNNKIIEVPTIDKATDMALIYHTYHTRPRWTPDDMKHYVYRDNNRTVEWLFDGFLFLEIFAQKDGIEYDYGVAHSGKLKPHLTEWNYLLDQTFDANRGPNAVESVLDSLATKGVYPTHKRNVVFSIPNPQHGQTDWGEINGEELDFNKPEDRLAAACWYVDRVLEEWNKRDYKHINLEGFYWLHETIDFHFGDDVLIKDVQKYVASKGYTLAWIPYYGAEGTERWTDFGFSVAYQQPNYFFDPNTPMEVMTNAIAHAKEYNMAMEMEFDDRVENNPAYEERFYTYIDEFTKAGIFDTKRIAYYQGSDAWLKMARSNDPKMKKMQKTLGDILVRRSNTFKTSESK